MLLCQFCVRDHLPSLNVFSVDGTFLQTIAYFTHKHLVDVYTELGIAPIELLLYDLPLLSGTLREEQPDGREGSEEKPSATRSS